MEADRFDALTRQLTATRSRRELALLAGSLAVGGAPALLGRSDAIAKKGQTKRKKKRKKRRCVPEPQTFSCSFARCDTIRDTRCGPRFACPCPTGKSCLGNGSCATVCVSDCPGTACPCSPDTDGERHCISGEGCAASQTCERTSDCPLGSHCQQCTGPEDLRCVALCPR